MSIKAFISFMSLLVISLYIAFLNPYAVAFKLTESMSFDIPIIIVILMSFFLGVLAFSLITLFLSSKNVVGRWRSWVHKKRLQKIDQLFATGNRFLFRGKTNMAFRFFKRIVQKDGNHLMALNSLGDIYREKGDYERAIDLHSKVLYLQKDDISALYSLAYDYERTGKLQEAAAILEKIKIIDSDSKKPLIALLKVYTKLENWTKACNVQENIFHLTKSKKSDKFEEEKNMLCSLFMKKARQFNDSNETFQAKAELKNALRVDKKHIPAYTLLTEILLKEDDDNSAIKLIKSGYKKTGDIVLLKLLEDIHVKQNKKEKMVPIYKSALSSDPNNPTLNLLLADLYVKLGKADESLEEIQKVEKVVTESPLLFKVKGALFEKKDDMASAIEEYRKAFDILGTDIIS